MPRSTQQVRSQIHFCEKAVTSLLMDSLEFNRYGRLEKQVNKKTQMFIVQ